MSHCCVEHDKPINKWMNPRAKGREQYRPTTLEHYANIATHAFAIVPSIIAVFYMINYSRSHAKYKSTIIYGTSLVMLFSVSTVFHVLSFLKRFRSTAWRTFFHYCDRATIYIFIASSYTPWLYLRSTNSYLGEYMFSIVWIGAVLGVLYQVVFHEKYKLLEVVFYLVIGICPSIVVIDMVDVSGLSELAIGGALYVSGVLFFKSDGVIPFAHAIWHVFVSVAACVHYYAILVYLIKEE